jgi:hypothetical protein
MKGLLATIWLVLGLSVSFAADRCAADDAAIKACVKQYLIDTNILINGVLADPGGLKTKAATESCQYDCTTKAAAFDQKFRQSP